eukprot:TRINITY_DN5008_c0_g2_i1.p1 TRINITY_DN5008_c0_g2~~TRINITY_DN5008_c0_g2_i1.p1  ORF type:complete len:337 (+),score=87.85 TRINITY_DN5008_c0_g2_i1:71-1081(+)
MPLFYSGGQYLKKGGKSPAGAPRNPPPLPSDVLTEMLKNRCIHIVSGPEEPTPRSAPQASSDRHEVPRAAKAKSAVNQRPRACQGWSAEDSKKAIKVHRKKQRDGIVGPNVKWTKIMEQEEEQKADERREVLNKRKAMMAARPWADPVVEEYPMPRPRALRNRHGQFIHNPQTTLTEQLFQPLQYDNRSSFHDLVASKKTGADFRSVSPRLHIDYACNRSKRDENERARRERLYAKNAHNRSVSAPSVKRRPIDDTPTTDAFDVTPPARHQASASPTPHKRHASVSPGPARMRGQFMIPRESDPRDIATGKSSATSAWARSTSPKIGSLRKQYFPV